MVADKGAIQEYRLQLAGVLDVALSQSGDGLRANTTPSPNPHLQS